MIGDVISLIEFLQKHFTEYAIKSALFSWDATRIEGDSFVEVVKTSTKDNRIWFYEVKERDGYEFVYMPVIPSLFIDYGMRQGSENPDARIFRFVGNPMAQFASGGEPNVKANFIVTGYRPKDLLASRERSV